MPVFVYAPATAIVVFCSVGILFALCAGPMMTLPAEVLTPAARSFGMGVFFTIYYGMMMIAPRIAGGIAEAAGDAGNAILFGAFLSLLSAGALVLFRRITP